MNRIRLWPHRCDVYSGVLIGIGLNAIHDQPYGQQTHSMMAGLAMEIDSGFSMFESEEALLKPMWAILDEFYGRRFPESQ